MINTKDNCPVSRGHKIKSTTTFTVDLGFGIVVVRHVPATICEQCGSEWIADKEAEQLEIVVDQAKHKHSQIEVSEYSPLLAS